MMTKKAACLVIVLFGVLTLSQARAECIDSLKSTTPTAEFQLGEGLVSHPKTALMWARCPIGFEWKEGGCLPVVGALRTLTWSEAQAEANASRLGNFSDWRLPNKNELMSLADHACTGPAINEAIFPDTPLGTFWTSSPSVLYPGRIWRVNFIVGEIATAVADQENKAYVRLVRDL